jgi:hypothetical protein
METRSFLDKILASEDYYTIWIKGDKITRNMSAETLDELVEKIQRIDATTNTVYHAIGKHNEWESHKKETATKFKCLCTDIDVDPNNNKKYPSQRDALAAVLTAFNKLQLPTPMLISSGYGWHVYLPLTRPIDKDEWVKLSKAFAASLLSAGVKIDTSKAFDPSMVLRPVGTHNKKNPQDWQLVECRQDADPIEPETLYPLLGVGGDKIKNLALSLPKQSQVSDALSGPEPEQAINPVPFAELRLCPQVAALEEAHGADTLEPLWRASLGIAKYCDDPQAAVEALAGGYPGFSMEENLRKMEQWHAGPPTCSYLENLNPEPCASCKFKGKVKSPVVLGTEIGKNLTDPRLAEIHFPKGYSWNGRALVYQTPGMDNPETVCNYLIYVVDQFADTERTSTTIKLAVKYPQEGWVELVTPHTTLSLDGREFNDFIYANQIWLQYGQPKRLRAYLVSYLSELKSQKASNHIYDSYGWQENGKFLVGDTLIGATGHEVIQYSKLAQQFNEKLQPKGSLQAWIEATSLFGLPELTHHGFVFLVGLSGPLTLASGVPGILINMYSPHSGSGKSLTGLFALSAWGDPERLFLTTRDTDTAIYRTLGTLQNLCAYIDEITMIDLDRLRGMLSSFSQGKERDRGTQGMKELLLGVTWNMPILSSSNQCLYTLLAQRLSSQGDMARILQMPFHREEIFNKGGANLGYKTARVLQNNYGLAGTKLVDEIMRRGGLQWAKEEFHNTLEVFSSKYNIEFTGPERFIQAGFVLADITGRLCTDIGLINFDATAAIQRAADEYKGHKIKEDKSTLEGPEIINQFLLEHASDIVFNLDKKHEGRAIIREPVPRAAVARYEVIVGKDDNFVGGNLIINRAAIRRWCRDNGLEYTHLLAQLTEYGVRHDDTEKLSLYRGVPGMGGVGQSRALKIDLISHPTFLENGRQVVGQAPNVTAEEIVREVKHA